jgi:hypothetical protein
MIQAEEIYDLVLNPLPVTITKGIGFTFALANETLDQHIVTDHQVLNFGTEADPLLYPPHIFIDNINTDGLVTIKSNQSVGNFTYNDTIILPGSNQTDPEGLFIDLVELVFVWDRGFQL